MSEQNNGGPAFPSKKLDISSGEYFPVNGMTLRDYFAAKATSSDIDRIMYEREKNCLTHMPVIYQAMSREEAKYAYADAMLKARG